MYGGAPSHDNLGAPVEPTHLHSAPKLKHCNMACMLNKYGRACTGPCLYIHHDVPAAFMHLPRVFARAWCDFTANSPRGGATKSSRLWACSAGLGQCAGTVTHGIHMIMPSKPDLRRISCPMVLQAGTTTPHHFHRHASEKRLAGCAVYLALGLGLGWPPAVERPRWAALGRQCVGRSSVVRRQALRCWMLYGCV